MHSTFPFPHLSWRHGLSTQTSLRLPHHQVHFGREFVLVQLQYLPVPNTPSPVPYLSRFENVIVKPHVQSDSPRSPATSLADGLFIHSSNSPPASGLRLQQLSKTIARAVASAGMDSPPARDVADPMSRTSGSTPSTSKGVLFSGTYGQVVTALVAAGLSITPCPATGVERGESNYISTVFNHDCLAATKLGALFVSRSNGNGVELTKLTLWG
jgi:hypothetical protein